MNLKDTVWRLTGIGRCAMMGIGGPGLAAALNGWGGNT
jgi:hypothetical protein